MKDVKISLTHLTYQATHCTESASTYKSVQSIIHTSLLLNLTVLRKNHQPGRKGAAPFVHDTDPRLYKPTVPLGNSLSVEVPASPSSRVLVPRDEEAAGCKGKLVDMQKATRHSRQQMLVNMDVARRSGNVQNLQVEEFVSRTDVANFLPAFRSAQRVCIPFTRHNHRTRATFCSCRTA